MILTIPACRLPVGRQGRQASGFSMFFYILYTTGVYSVLTLRATPHYAGSPNVPTMQNNRAGNPIFAKKEEIIA